MPHHGEHLQICIAQNPVAGFGYQLWDAASALCCYLEQHEGQCHGRKILELGAGCGLVGILAYFMGAQVTLSDVADVLPILKLNADLNTLSADAWRSLDVRELEWGTDIREALPRSHFDMILGSDLTYSDKLHGLLIATLLQLVSEETEIILAVTRRDEDGVERWRRRFQRYFDMELLATEEDVAGYASLGFVAKAGKPISIFQLHYVGPPPFEEDLTAILATEHADGLLACLGLRDCDLASTEVNEDVDEPV